MSKQKKDPQQLAEEVYRLGHDASGPELSNIVTEVLERNGDDPQDPAIRKEVGRYFRNLICSAA